MNMDLLFSRTDKGQNALTDKYVQLSHSLMRALIIVDGNRRVGELHEMAPLYDDLEEALQTLIDDKFIQVKPELKAKKLEEKPVKKELSEPAISVNQRLILLLNVELGSMQEKQVSVTLAKMVNNVTNTNEKFEDLSVVWKKCIKIIRMTIDEQVADLMLESGSRILEKLRK